MSVTWSLTRERIADKGLEKVKAIAAGGTPEAADRSLALEALDGLLKELPWHGFSWPKTVSGQTSLTLVAATQITALPSDYYGNAVLTYLDASLNELPIGLVQFADWNAIIQKTQAAKYPKYGYIDNFLVLRTWPIQSANVTAKLVYQKVIDDTVASTAPDVNNQWFLSLPYGIAAEIGFEFGRPLSEIQAFSAIWAQRRDLGIANQTFPAPDRVQVRE